jgi:hypothetical protein
MRGFVKRMRRRARVAPVLALAGYLAASPTPDAITVASIGARAAFARRNRVELRHRVRPLRWAALASHAL